MNNLLKGLLAVIGIGGVYYYVTSKKEDVDSKQTKSSNTKKKGKYNPQPYSVSLKKYGHLKSLKDYPKKIRYYEPDGEYENRTFEKWNSRTKKWKEIDSVEFDYFNVSAEDNIGYEYIKKSNTGDIREWELKKI
jgi:hypothetical protein